MLELQEQLEEAGLLGDNFGEENLENGKSKSSLHLPGKKAIVKIFKKLKRHKTKKKDKKNKEEQEPSEPDHGSPGKGASTDPTDLNTAQPALQTQDHDAENQASLTTEESKTPSTNDTDPKDKKETTGQSKKSKSGHPSGPGADQHHKQTEELNARLKEHQTHIKKLERESAFKDDEIKHYKGLASDLAG